MKVCHASNDDTQTLHNGICFGSRSVYVNFYGQHIYEIELDWDEYKVAEMELVERDDNEDRWVWRETETGLEIRTMANEWPGDCADTTRALIEAGFDACVYIDWDVSGDSYWCYRLLQLRAEDVGRVMQRAE